MSDFTAAWQWPQWFAVIWMVIHFALISAKHGDPYLIEGGAKKGQPKVYSAFDALLRVVIFAFVLIAGGFFA